ncbi:MAG TPA: M1 family aminopeptidase, partial [Terriglobia bacterium]|nr:M1 family aminopeptidase [Terriglobia bacterium]
CSTHRFESLGLTAPAFVIDEFQVLSRPAVTVYYEPEHKQYAENYAAAVEAVQPFISEWFGPNREKVRIVELDQPGAAPEESGSMLLTPLGPGDSAELEAAVVHQVAHAAFSSFRPWMEEGLAQFAQAVWRERRQGRQKALEFLGAQLPALVGAEKQACEANKASGSQDSSSRQTKLAPVITQACGGGGPLMAAYDEVNSHIKAAYVWWMLRDMVGDAPLQRAIQSYRADQDKEPAYFQNLLKAQSHQDLEWFFDDWVYRDRGLPDFRVLSVYPRESLGGGYVVTVTVENQGNAGADVPVMAIAPEGEKLARVYVPKNSSAAIRIQIATRPAEAAVNDGSVPESDRSNNEFKVAGERQSPEEPGK